MQPLPSSVRPRLVIVDLEATCWPPGEHRPERMETIEIGAVLTRSDSLDVLDEFTTFVRPIREPVLSNFCRSLTSIRQEDVDGAQPFREGFGRFVEWLGDLDDVTFGSWGAFDRKQFLRDCGFQKVHYPFGDQEDHFNVKKYVAQKMGWSPRGLAPAIQSCGMEFEGTHHRGIDDARNIHRVLRVSHGLPSD